MVKYLTAIWTGKPSDIRFDLPVSQTFYTETKRSLSWLTCQHFRCWKLLQILEQKYCHFDKIFITGCTRSCQNDNFWYSQWWKFCQIDSISVLVKTIATTSLQPPEMLKKLFVLLVEFFEKDTQYMNCTNIDIRPAISWGVYQIIYIYQPSFIVGIAALPSSL